VKRLVLEGIHWSVLIFLVISSIIFVFEVAPLRNSDQMEIKDNRIVFCEDDKCVNLGEKIYWTFLEIFMIEIIVGGLALFAIREEISLEKRGKKDKSNTFDS
jgi:hypothetical protein